MLIKVLRCLNGIERHIEDFARMSEVVQAQRILNKKIVLTSGSFDLGHIGHYRYLKAAKIHGDVLVVGIDSDEKIRKSKGADRPIVPCDERVEDLLFQEKSVDYVFIKELEHEHWQLITVVRPDVLIATAETYSVEEIKLLEAEYCGKVVVLEPMATTSTTARIRIANISFAERLRAAMASEIPGFIDSVIADVAGEDK